MLWLFAATPADLRAALPTWIDALPEPTQKELLNPFTRQRAVESTYNPNPDGDYDDPPEEAPPPFLHATIWEPEGRVGWSTLYEVVTGEKNATERLLYREVLCGRPGAPCVCHVVESFRSGLLRVKTATVPALAQRWAKLASERFSRPVDLEEWTRLAEASLRDVERWTATDPQAPWFIWEDAYDW